MADHDHHHHHGHHHGHSQEGPEMAQAGLDAAGDSLSRALRLSFKILTFIIILLCAIFLFKGVFSVESDQKALVLRFGAAKPSLVMDTGLHFAFPYPIDEVVPVVVKPKKLEVNTFWRNVTSMEKAEALEKGKEPPKEIQGTENAYIISGDLNILQARWDVTYYVDSDHQSVLDYYNRIGTQDNEIRLIRSLVQSAAIASVGKMNIFDIYPGGQAALKEEVKRRLVETLNEMQCGLEIKEVSLIEIRPPEAVLPAFDQLIEAQQESDQMRKEAERDAGRILIETAGAIGPKLGETIQAWWLAKDEGRTEDMAALDRTISELYADAGGQARTILANARAYKTTVVESAKGDASQITSLLANKPDDVKIFLDHIRIRTLEEMLDNAFEKFLYRPGVGGARPSLDVMINRRPEILREQNKVQDTF